MAYSCILTLQRLFKLRQLQVDEKSPYLFNFRPIIDNFDPFKPEFTIVIFIHYNPRIAVALFSKQFNEHFRPKTNTLRSSVCAYTLLRRVLIHGDCKRPSPTPSTTLPLYEMITCFI